MPFEIQVRKQIEDRENASLSAYAMRSSQSLGRRVPLPPDDLRTEFQRDRDRILHSKAFRRLKHKTQVFIAPAGDHYRTRLTHTLEVAQIARTIGRALRLNEDLIEAIALGHDVGHTPFGHAGERGLDKALRELDDFPKEFRHYEQSLRVVDVLEPLNLTEETRLGIAGHSKGRNDLTAHDGQPISTLEAAVVRVSDRIAYLSHDLDDAIRAGIISGAPDSLAPLGRSHGKRVGTMVRSVIETSWDQPAIRLDPAILDLMNSLKEFLFESVYLNREMVLPDAEKAERLVGELLWHFAGPGVLPTGFTGTQGAVDWVAGMTDRFALETFLSIRTPREFRPL